MFDLLQLTLKRLGIQNYVKGEGREGFLPPLVARDFPAPGADTNNPDDIFL